MKIPTTLVFLALLEIVAMEEDGEFDSVNRETDWNEVVNFWGRTTCRAGRRRLFSLYEISESDPSRRLSDFFGDLVTDVQNKCVATMSTKSYTMIKDTYNPTFYNLFSNYEKEEIIDEPPIFLENYENEVSENSSNTETNLFPHQDVEILVITVDDSIPFLMNGNFFHNWDNGRYVLVLVITRGKESTKSTKSLIDIFTILLQSLWKEHRILNTFFAAPFSRLGRRIWFYDPFVKNATSGLRGRILAVRPSSIANIPRVLNLEGYRLNIGMFETHPAVIKYGPENPHNFPFMKEARGYVGMDGLTMTTIANHMNFTVNIVPPTDGIEYGHVLSNGTLVGTIGDAAYNRIDIGFNSMYTKIYTPGKLKAILIEFTLPIDFDRLCIVVPRAQKIPRWLRTFYYFHPAIWVCLVITQFFVALIWYALRNFQNSSRLEENSRANYSLLLIATIFLFVGAPITFRATQVERIILAALLLFGLTVMGTFTGTLYHSFTNEMYYKEIDSLKELDASGIAVSTGSPNLHDVFGLEESNDEAIEIRHLRQKFKITDYDGTSTMEKTACRSSGAALTRERTFEVLKHRYIDDTGASLIHLVRECPRSYYLSYVVPKNSVYIERLNELVARLIEAGLPALWNSVTTNKLVVAESVKAKLRRKRATHLSFDLRDMQTPFLLLSMGLLVAVCIFIGEISYGTRRRAWNVIKHRLITGQRHT